MKRWQSTLTLTRRLASSLVGAALLCAPAARAQSVDDVIAADEQHADDSHREYLACKLRYRQNPIPVEAVSLVTAGSRSASAADRLESVRLGRAWLRAGSLKGAAAEEVQAALRASTTTLGRLTFVLAPTEPVRVDGEAVEVAALLEGWDVLPGTHRVAVGGRERVVSVTAGETVTLERETPAGVAASTSAAPPKRTYWSDAKLATEVTLVLCAAGGIGTGATLLAVPLDEPKGTRTAEDTHGAVAAVGFSLGAACLVGAVLVPALWRNTPVGAAQAPRGIVAWSPFGVAGRF